MASRKNKVGKSQVQGIDYDGMNQREVAEVLGVSRVAVQQAEKRAIAKIKKALAERNIDVKDLLWHHKNNRKKNVNNENDKENKTISREQVVLWAYEAGFSTNFVRGEITRFEKLANLVKKYMERDYKWV